MHRDKPGTCAHYLYLKENVSESGNKVYAVDTNEHELK